MSAVTLTEKLLSRPSVITSFKGSPSSTEIPAEIRKLDFDIPSKIGTPEGNYLIQKQFRLVVEDLIIILQNNQTPAPEKLSDYSGRASLAGDIELSEFLRTIKVTRDYLGGLEIALTEIKLKEERLRVAALDDKTSWAKYRLERATLEAKALGIE